MNINPKDAANELFILYKRTLYECNLRKLQKLIIFADMFWYVQHNRESRLLADDIITANACGLAINSIMTTPYKIVINYLNATKEITDDEIDNEKEIELVSVYKYDATALSKEVIDLLLLVFKRFGAYHGDILTTMSQRTTLWQEAYESENQCVTMDLYRKHIDYKTIEDLTYYLSNLARED